MFADIHAHSNASDGSCTPSELVSLAKEKGLSGLSITDHDTILAYQEAIPAAQKLGLKLGVGIEFSCVFEENDVHLLGYDFDLHSPEIAHLCERHQNRRAHRNLQIIEKLRDHKIDISLDEIQGAEGSIGRPHIAELLLKKGYVGSIKEAFHRYLGEGKSCYARGDILTVDETIETLHKAHGKAFIAHPQLLSHAFPIDKLLEKPFDGIECWYGNLSPKSAEKWERIARTKKWLMSGGSDFHGSIKPDIALGSQGVTEEIFNQIFEHTSQLQNSSIWKNR